MPHVNKDLILREKLAIERTVMANDRTLLSFVRTALYFSIAGLSIDQLVVLPHGFIIKVVSYFFAIIVLVTGVIKYRQQLKNIQQSRKHIGHYLAEDL